MSYIILAIESSCDNSSLCIMDEDKNILFYKNINQENMIEEYGGYVPNIMVDKHIYNFYNIISEFCNARYLQIDYVALCCGPGILLSLNIGYAVGIAIAKFYNAKIIYVDHIEAHIWSHAITMKSNPYRPFISVIASGGHCIVAYVESVNKMSILANSTDDAPGEVFDKIAYQLKLSPATGASIDKIAKEGAIIPELVNLKRSKKRNTENFYHLSFSGLKTRFKNFLAKNKTYNKADIALSLQAVIYNEIYYALSFCLQSAKPEYIAFSGGVMANSYIRNKLETDIKDIELNFVEIQYAQDNAIMIGNLAIIAIKHNMTQTFCCYQRSPYDTFLFNMS